MNRPAQLSYLLLAILAGMVAWLHLGTFVLSALFAYLTLQIFSFRRSKLLSVALFSLSVIILGAGLIYFANRAFHTLPKIAETSIPAMVEYAEKNGIDLPFTDYASLKSSALDEAQEGIATIGRYARVASYQTVLLLAGLAVALSIFLNPSWTAGFSELPPGEDLYSAITREFSVRISNLYRSFARVMGAQIVIAAINTGLTAIFLLSSHYPYKSLLLFLVFLCGLLPIVGNLISNVIIVGVGFTLSPRMGIAALVFLIAIHKSEYFLNSKIIGRRIHSPFWLTLIGLLLGERLMGIPGMILAPVVLDYLKVESAAHHPAEEVALVGR